ncbi:MAG: efflux RND transporter periplasmic adaptor subunit [Chloroflexi bacterium]|nr:efflux RND transporter periplasmic adaptor subunit [Chloroflexota bacterium]
MKTWILTTGAFLLIALAGCSGAGPAAPATPTGPAQAVKAPNLVVAEGKVVPAKYATLSMAAGGIASEVLVKEGDSVAVDQTLVRLASGQQQAAVSTAQAALSHAQAARQKLFQGADENDVTLARADLANAESTLRQAQAAYDQAGGSSNPYASMLPTSVQLEQATASYNAAKARLGTLLTPPKPADIAAADADIASAQADLERAQAALKDTELHSPIAGTVATVDIKAGEQVGVGTPIIRIADLSDWEIQTTDLTEINVVRVKAGDPVTTTFDAIPELQLPGTVSDIDTLGENRQGDIVYTVTVKPANFDERLRWNMTAKVSIQPTD